MKKTKLFSLIVVAMVACLGLSMPAKAQSNKYAVLCLANNTDAQITYSYRWGNGQWQTSYLDVGETDMHTWRYTARAASPNFKISFDTDPSNYISTQAYYLDRYSAWGRNCLEGKNYAFEYTDWAMIDLYALD